MAAASAPTRRTWPAAADALAERVNRRARIAAALRVLGWSLLAASVVALLVRAFVPTAGPAWAVVGAVLALGLVVALVPAWQAARRAPRVASADAAWALDRLAQARGRGLAAAAVTGAAASEAAHAGGGLDAPPDVRLLPPRGLLPLVGAAVLTTIALLVPEPGAAEATPTAGAAGGAGLVRTDAAGAGDAAPELGADVAEGEAQGLEARADAADAVREALGLPPEGPIEPAALERRLADAERRREAADAARPDPTLAELLGGDDPSSEALARLLARSEDNRALASERRRSAAGARAGSDRLAVPPSRRGVVERYLELLDRP